MPVRVMVEDMPVGVGVKEVKVAGSIEWLTIA